MKPDPRTGLPYLPNDLEMRLSRSLVKYNGRPFFIEDVEPNCVLVGRYLDTQREARCELPNGNLDIRPVPIGYVNMNTRCLFITRAPQRRYKQGLNESNIRVLTQRHWEPRINLRDLLLSKNMARTVNNEYPSLEQCLEELRTKKSQAFCRRFAVQNEKELGVVSLQYRGRAVGIVLGDEVQLNSKNRFLQEELELALAGEMK
jgi:hypothetical protein